MLGYLSADITRSKKRTDNVQGQISEHISAAKLRLLCLLSIGFKIGEYPWIFPSFSWGIFAHVMRLDQSRASENI